MAENRSARQEGRCSDHYSPTLDMTAGRAKQAEPL